MKAYSLRDARRLASGTKDWRKALWNKWLVDYLMPRGDADNAHEESAKAGPSETLDQPPTPGAQPDGLGVNAASYRASLDTLRPGPPEEDTDAAPASTKAHSYAFTDQVGEETDLDFSRTRRAYALRARLDHMVSQLDALELSFQRQTEREGLSKVQERVQQRALADILDRLVEAQERHTQGIISCTRALERLERRLISLERQGRVGSIPSEAPHIEEGVYYASSSTESIVPPSMTQRVQASSSSGSARDAVAPLSGKLSEISLPTLLSMAELEHWTGRLTLDAGQRTVLLDIEAGLLVGVFEDDSPSDAVETLYDLIEARNGGFSFTPARQINKTELAPMTVGTLLLRASHRRDELSRAEVVTSA